VESEVAAQSRKLLGRGKNFTKEASFSPSEAEKSLKTSGEAKIIPLKADNILKTNTVS